MAAVFLFAALAADADNEDRTVRLATTTSTDNSGLLDYLLPQFERDRGYAVQVISVGTGKALRLGESGDVDVLLVHAPRSERRFIELGYGVSRKEVMANDFVIVGPKSDPANLRKAASAADAFNRLRRSESLFVSRGDDSGTHKKELAIWKAAGHVAGKADWGPWRLEVGQGMGRSLQIADELQAYLLIDRGTWIFHKQQTSLELLYGGGERLRNPYGVLAVNPQRHRINIAGAMAFIDWLTSKGGQAAIGDYTIKDTRLFTPTAAQIAAPQTPTIARWNLWEKRPPKPSRCCFGGTPSCGKSSGFRFAFP